MNSKEKRRGMRTKRLRTIVTLKMIVLCIVCSINIGTWVRLSQVYLQKLSNIK